MFAVWYAACAFATGPHTANVLAASALLCALLELVFVTIKPIHVCPRYKVNVAVPVDEQVQADVRTILSRDFATRHSLRFPRVERIRYDKSPFDVQTDQQLWDLVNQNKGGMIGMIKPKP